MHKINCIIADDEPLALELMQNLLRPIPDIHIACACANGIEALKCIRESEPDLVFLDIEMPGLSGFDIVRRLQTETMPLVIFITAYNQYAIDAFNIHAVDYLLKPLNSERLRLAVKRARMRLQGDRHLREHRKTSILDSIDKLSDSPAEALSSHDQEQPGGEPASTLLIRDSGKTHVVAQESIGWVDAAGDYMCIHVGAKTFVARTTMKKLEDQLDARKFVRIHRSTIVNVAQIKEIQNVGKGDHIITLDCDARLRVSRHYRARLLAYLQ